MLSLTALDSSSCTTLKNFGSQKRRRERIVTMHSKIILDIYGDSCYNTHIRRILILTISTHLLINKKQ